MYPHQRAWGTAGLSLLFASLLTACGGGDGDSATDPQPTEPSTPIISNDPGRKVLLVDVDGVSYSALRAALDAGRTEGLDGLQVAPVWTGGRTGTRSEQTTTGRPSWATLLSGRWVDGHGIGWEADGGERLSDSVLARIKQANATLKTGVVADQASYLSLLKGTDGQAADLDTLGDCSADAAAATCVATQAGALVDQGYDLTVAHIGAVSGQPTQTLSQMAQALQSLRAQLAQRQSSHPKEDWLLLVTSGYGADRFGSATGAQSLDSKSVFIAANQTLPALNDVGAAQPESLDALYTHAALTDIAPTLLRHLELDPSAGDYAYTGQALQSSPTIRSAQAVPGQDKDRLELSWTLGSTPSSALRLLRDGTEIAQLPADAVSYTDDELPAQQDGLVNYRYTLVAGDAMQAIPARIDYVKPMQLAPTLTTGLVSYYSFDNGTALDLQGMSTLKPWDSSADGGSALDADNFAGKWQSKAWRVDSRVVGSTGLAGYTLRQASGDITDNPQFTVGFWFRTNDICSGSISNGVPMLSNKNWNSGGNKGITIGLWSGCEVRFNLGGSGRIDATGNSLSDGQWAYVALVIDRANGEMTSYLFDPVKGTQKSVKSFSTALGAMAPGLGNGFTLGEDGTGKYITNENTANSPRSAMDYNDLATWNRVLSEDELTSIYRSGRPLSTLQQ